MAENREELFRMYEDMEFLKKFDVIDSIEGRDGKVTLFHGHGGTTVIHRDGSREITMPTNERYISLFKKYGNPEPGLVKIKDKISKLFGGK